MSDQAFQEMVKLTKEGLEMIAKMEAEAEKEEK